jgi:hypothetical protein
VTIEVRTTRCLLKPNTYGNVRLYEIPLTAFNLSNGGIEWPPSVPLPEAVMLCYDAGVKSSFDGILRFLSLFSFFFSSSSSGRRTSLSDFFDRSLRSSTGLKDSDLPYLVCGLKSAGVPCPVELPAAQVAEKVGKYVCSISVEDDKTTRFMHKGFSFLMREAHNRRRGPSSTLVFHDLVYPHEMSGADLFFSLHLQVPIMSPTKILLLPLAHTLPLHRTSLPVRQPSVSLSPPQQRIQHPSIPEPHRPSTRPPCPPASPAIRSSPRRPNDDSPTRSAGIPRHLWVISSHCRRRAEERMGTQRGRAR